MRILVFSNFPPYVLGGAENQVARLVGAWRHTGNIVGVAGHRIPTTKVTVEGHQVQTHRIWTFNRAGRLGRALTYLISTLLLLIRQGTKFDIIYCRGMGDAAISVSLAKALRITRSPLVACPINAKGKGDANFIKSIPGWRIIVRLLNRYCNAVNIIAPAITDDLRKLNINIPLMASIPNGIPIQPRLSSKSADSPRRMIFTGRLCHQKGLDLLITALGKLRTRGYQFQLDIVGDGPLKGELETLIDKLALGEHIHLRGKVPAREIRSLLVQYNALVLPSRYEGMSNSALEAMEAGIPVLATRCGGIDHYIDSSRGWICEPEDLNSLTDSLRSLLETPPDLLVNMGARVRAMVENKFEMEIIARKNIALMKLALGSE